MSDMKIIEYMKNIFSPYTKLPRDFVRNPEFDAVYLVDSLGYVPEVVHAKDGKTYLYFTNVNGETIRLVRKMGFRLQLHKSHKYMPARYVFRAHIKHDMPREVLDIVNKFTTVYHNGMLAYKLNPEYMKYIANYNMKMK